jgi:internalin A
MAGEKFQEISKARSNGEVTLGRWPSELEWRPRKSLNTRPVLVIKSFLVMKKLIGNFALVFFLLMPIGQARAADAEPPPKPLFVDKNLEAAVRRYVFDKRENDKPLVEADLLNLSTIEAKGLGITNLTGLEKCRELASLDLSNNKISDLTPLKGKAKLQSLTLAENQIEDVSPLADIAALQYLELSRNRVKDVRPLQGLTNMASLYLSNNQITDIAPVVKYPKLSSLYLDHNQIKSIEGIHQLKGLFTLSLSHNVISDLAPLAGLPGLYNLFLEGNQIRDLGPLLEMAKKDQEQRFAPFLNVYLKGNPLSGPAKGKQTAELKKLGTRINN